jgi:hypothetical protein
MVYFTEWSLATTLKFCIQNHSFDCTTVFLGYVKLWSGPKFFFVSVRVRGSRSRLSLSHSSRFFSHLFSLSQIRTDLAAATPPLNAATTPRNDGLQAGVFLCIVFGQMSIGAP